MGIDCRAPQFAAMAVAAFLAGCTTFSPDGGFDEVRKLASERIGQNVSWQRTDEDVQSAAATVGNCSRVRSAPTTRWRSRPQQPGPAGRLRRPRHRGGRRRPGGPHRQPAVLLPANEQGGERKIEWALMFPIFDLITMPLKMKIEDQRFRRAQFEAARNALDFAIEARKAWVGAVAAEETVRYMEQVKETAERAPSLPGACRGRATSPAHADARTGLLRRDGGAARARAAGRGAERERLVRLMGLYGEDVGFRLPERLPDPPAALPERGDVESVAIEQRLDVRAARRDSEELAESLGLTKTTRFINVLDVGPARNKEDREPGRTDSSSSSRCRSSTAAARRWPRPKRPTCRP